MSKSVRPTARRNFASMIPTATRSTSPSTAGRTRAGAWRISLSANRCPPSDQVRGQASPGYALGGAGLGFRLSARRNFLAKLPVE
jgi:hypothetical protein